LGWSRAEDPRRGSSEQSGPLTKPKKICYRCPSNGPSPCHFHRRFLRISTNLAASGFRHQPEPSPRFPATCAVAALETGLGCRNGRARPRFRGPTAIGETPCRLKPRPTGPRAPGGRWVSGGFLRPAVCYGPARPATGPPLVCMCGSAALAWPGERDGWAFGASWRRFSEDCRGCKVSNRNN
jgi:hypothetical protein